MSNSLGNWEKEIRKFPGIGLRGLANAKPGPAGLYTSNQEREVVSVMVVFFVVAG